MAFLDALKSTRCGLKPIACLPAHTCSPPVALSSILRAGAIGFSTSRTILHRSKHGLVPGTLSKPEELLGIGRALGDAGHGVFEMVADLQGHEPDLTWMKRFCSETGRAITFAIAQTAIQPNGWRETLTRADELAEQIKASQGQS